MANVEYRTFESTRQFGIELEAGVEISRDAVKKVIQANSKRPVRVTDWEQTQNNDYWHVKHDSTCGLKAHLHKDYGWEVASYVGKGHDDILHIADVSQKLHEAGLRANNNCGLHIHAETKDFKPDQMGVLLARWIKIEPIVAMMVPVRRIRSKYCRLWVKSLAKKINVRESYSGGDLWKLCRPTNFSPHSNRQKKVSLNFVNYAYSLHLEQRGYGPHRKTVELRLPEGTLDAIDIACWTRFYLSFVDRCLGQPMPEKLDRVADINEFFDFVGLGHRDNFCILDEALFQTKVWALRRIASCEWVVGGDGVRPTQKGKKFREDASTMLAQMLEPQKALKLTQKPSRSYYIKFDEKYLNVATSST